MAIPLKEFFFSFLQIDKTKSTYASPGHVFGKQIIFVQIILLEL